MNALVDYENRDGVAILTLRNPPANCYSYELMQALDVAVLRFRMDAAAHVGVVVGAGDKFFCAGADIAMLKGADPTFKYYFCLHANETLCRLEQTPKLVIGAINGHCVGGGLEVVLACDLRIARRGAGKMGLPEAKLGVLPGTGGTQRLARVVGKSKAIELMATAETFDADRALALGLVTQVIEAASGAEFLEKVVTWARQFTPPTAAAGAIGRIKRAVQSGAEMSFGDGLALERELQQLLFTGADAGEGLAAYLEKRTPRFTGK